MIQSTREKDRTRSTLDLREWGCEVCGDLRVSSWNSEGEENDGNGQRRKTTFLGELPDPSIACAHRCSGGGGGGRETEVGDHSIEEIGHERVKRHERSREHQERGHERCMPCPRAQKVKTHFGEITKPTRVPENQAGCVLAEAALQWEVV